MFDIKHTHRRSEPNQRLHATITFADIESDPRAERESHNSDSRRRRSPRNIIDDSQQILTFTTSAIKGAFALPDAAKIESNRFDPRLADVAGAARHDFVFHRTPKLRVRMANDSGLREMRFVSARTPER